MPRHVTRVEEVKKKDLLHELEARAVVSAGERANKGLFGDEVREKGAGPDEYAAEEKRLLETLKAEGYADGNGFAAFCSCGWSANNPLPTRELAQANADHHETQIYGGDG